MIDLKDLLEERSAQTPGFDHLRLGLVQRRITRRRRKRLATTLAVVVLLLFGGYALSPAAHTQKNPVPATTPSPTPPAGNPDYANGQHRVASAIAPAADRKVTLQWTPVATRQDISIECHQTLTEAENVKIEVRVNNAVITGAGASGCNLTIMTDPKTYEWKGIPLGTPATLTVSIVEGNIDGFLMAAVWVPVPFDEYPLPQRPAELKALVPFGPCDSQSFGLLSSDPADPVRPVRLSVPAARYLNLTVQSTTPGHLRYSVEGEATKTSTHWDYQGISSMGLELTPLVTTGMVTVIVTPEKVSGPWQVAVVPGNSKASCVVENGQPVSFVDVSPSS